MRPTKWAEPLYSMNPIIYEKPLIQLIENYCILLSVLLMCMCKLYCHTEANEQHLGKQRGNGISFLSICHSLRWNLDSNGCAEKADVSKTVHLGLLRHFCLMSEGLPIACWFNKWNYPFAREKGDRVPMGLNITLP
jgi:hypothetical protein